MLNKTATFGRNLDQSQADGLIRKEIKKASQHHITQ
jgi:hypothetical protein